MDTAVEEAAPVGQRRRETANPGFRTEGRRTREEREVGQVMEALVVEGPFLGLPEGEEEDGAEAPVAAVAMVVLGLCRYDR